MRVFLDECIDWRLSRELAGHSVKTARQMGWTGIKNGELLTRAAELFDVFVTVDRSVSFQQRPKSFDLALIILYPKQNRLRYLKPLVPDLLAAIASAAPRTVTAVGR